MSCIVQCWSVSMIPVSPRLEKRSGMSPSCPMATLPTPQIPLPRDVGFSIACSELCSAYAYLRLSDPPAYPSVNGYAQARVLCQLGSEIELCSPMKGKCGDR